MPHPRHHHEARLARSGGVFRATVGAFSLWGAVTAQRNGIVAGSSVPERRDPRAITKLGP